MKGLTLTQKEQARLQVLNGILEGQISVDEAAEVLGVSERHVWRILAEYRKEGAAALAHGNRGRRANNSIPEEARTQVVALARTRYARVNHTHLTELLAEREEIVLGRSTVRRILVGAGMASPRRRRPPLHRVRRQRMSQEGMLVQVDGSVHAWLEERGPRCTLLLAIDDATSTVPYALFRHEEDTHGYFLLMQELIRRCGVPLALYSDRHAVFKYVPGSHQSPAPTQFGRAMAELGVEQIFARSPEAKGRVERANGTFQDRLVTELRLAGARTISEANQVLWAFLTRFNKRFGVPPAQSTNAYRSPRCFKSGRTGPSNGNLPGWSIGCGDRTSVRLAGARTRRSISEANQVLVGFLDPLQVKRFGAASTSTVAHQRISLSRSGPEPGRHTVLQA